MKAKWIFGWTCAGILFLFSCSPSEQQAIKTGSSDSLPQKDSLRDAVPEKIPFYRDSIIDFTARYLAGIPQLSVNAFSELETEQQWLDHRAASDKNWTKLETDRLDAMRQWQKDSLSAHINDTLPLFYPFSGPDFLHPSVLFPETNTYVFCALEPIIRLPEIISLTEAERKSFLQSLESSLRDIYGKSYFITTHMMDDFKSDKAKGVLPVFYVFLARTGHEILEMDQVLIDSSGTLVDSVAGQQNDLTKGVRFRFRRADSDTLKELYYFSLDVSNKGLSARASFMNYLDKLGKVNTMIKSASYMLHYSTFSKLREKILAMSVSIFQDDTGIPYKYFRNSASWKTILYGEYSKPVKDFGDYVFQKDLDSLYASGYPASKLPFHLGYHWNDKKQTQQLYLKR